MTTAVWKRETCHQWGVGTRNRDATVVAVQELPNKSLREDQEFLGGAASAVTSGRPGGPERREPGTVLGLRQQVDPHEVVVGGVVEPGERILGGRPEGARAQRDQRQ